MSEQKPNPDIEEKENTDSDIDEDNELDLYQDNTDFLESIENLLSIIKIPNRCIQYSK